MRSLALRSVARATMASRSRSRVGSIERRRGTSASKTREASRLVLGVVEKAAAGEEFPKDHAESADVGGGTDGDVRGGELLGSGVTQRAEKTAALSDRQRETAALRQAEIH